MVPGAHACNFRTRFDDNAAAFMSQKMREKFVGPLDPVDLADLRSANSADLELDENLSVSERRYFNLVDDERFMLFDQKSTLGFHDRLVIDEGHCAFEQDRF